MLEILKMRIKRVQCDRLLSVPVFIANSTVSFFRLQWALTCVSICEIWRPNFYSLSCASKLDISDITHTHLQLHIYFNCCSYELVSLETYLGAELHETSSVLKFDTVGWRNGSTNVTRGSIPGVGVIYGLSLLLVLFSAPRGFSPGAQVFPSPQKPTLLNCNSPRNTQTLNGETTPHVLERK